MHLWSVQIGHSIELSQTPALLPRASQSSNGSIGSESGFPIGLMVGVIVAVFLICVAAAVTGVIYRRTCRWSDQSSQTEQSTLYIGFVDDHLDTTNDTNATTFCDSVTIEGGFEVPASLMSGFAIDNDVFSLS
jgi:hypothetical protein